VSSSATNVLAIAGSLRTASINAACCRAMRTHCCLLLLLASTSTMAIDLAPLWDFDNPDASELRFRQALTKAAGEDRLILQTQIARTHGLRKDFAQARRILGEIEPAMAAAGPEAQARYYLELGRTLASATHEPGDISPEGRALARQSYDKALSISRQAGLDALAVDAIHMFAFLDTSPADQLKWAEAALKVVQASSQADARRWEASIRNNMGYALHQLGRHEEALDQFQQALVLREQGTNQGAIRIARWMVAWTLRSLGRVDDAMAIQLRLEEENDSAGTPDPDVFEELEALYRARNDASRAEHYAKRRSLVAGH
jgi:tetratricopeptide (TPR) repeat protein